MIRFPYAAAALLAAAFFSQSAAASCYVVYGPDKDIVYRAPEPPIDMSRQIHETLPLVAPALRRGMAFAAATMLGEFAVSLFLSRPEWTTLTTLIYQRLGRPGAANLDAALVLACGLMALALLVFVCLEKRETPHA